MGLDLSAIIFKQTLRQQEGVLTRGATAELILAGTIPYK